MVSLTVCLAFYVGLDRAGDSVKICESLHLEL